MRVRDHWRSPESPGLTSLNQLLVWVRSEGARPRLSAKRSGVWTAFSAEEFFQQVRRVADGLGRRGVQPGDRVAILAESRPEWLVADFACLATGVINVPIYPTLTGEQAAFLLRDSGAVGVFVSTGALAGKVASVRAGLPDLRWVCAFESTDWEEWIAASATETEAAFTERLEATPTTQAATLLYTSGTTGEPKGLILRHSHLCANLNESSRGFHFGENERRLSILPLSHITERHMAYVDMLYGGTTYFAESMETVVENLREVKPTVLVSVPRLYEKIAAGVQAQAEAKSGLARRIFHWSLGVGREMGPFLLREEPAPAKLRWRAAIADRLVWGKLRAKMGGCLRIMVSGGAPLGKELAEFLLSMGVVVYEGYGLSETSPVVAINRPGAVRPGSIGKALANVEVRFAEDGEMLVRGPSVFDGYYHLPEKTAAALREGWFQSGDIGRRDEDGFLYITDRKKDLIKTSGGKFIAPQPIEARLKASPLIAEAVVVGDGRNYANVLIVPDWAALEAGGLDCRDRAAACVSEAVRTRIGAVVEAVNAGLARFETLKKFALLPEAFTVESGELTPTVKVRRRAVEVNHRAVIDGFYSGGSGRPA